MLETGVDAERIAEEMEPMTDGGRDVEDHDPPFPVDLRTDPGAVEDFLGWMESQFTESELRRLADETRATETTDSKRAKREVRRRPGIRAVDSGDHGRARFVRKAAQHLLDQMEKRRMLEQQQDDHRADGGGRPRRAGQPAVEQVGLRHLVAGVLILLFVLGGGGGGDG